MIYLSRQAPDPPTGPGASRNLARIMVATDEVAPARARTGFPASRQ